MVSELINNVQLHTKEYFGAIDKSVEYAQAGYNVSGLCEQFCIVLQDGRRASEFQNLIATLRVRVRQMDSGHCTIQYASLYLNERTTIECFTLRSTPVC